MSCTYYFVYKILKKWEEKKHGYGGEDNKR